MQLDDADLPPDICEPSALLGMPPDGRMRGRAAQDGADRAPLRRHDDERDLRGANRVSGWHKLQKRCETHTGEDEADGETNREVEGRHGEDDDPDGRILERRHPVVRVPHGLLDEVDPEDEDEGGDDAYGQEPDEAGAREEHADAPECEHEARKSRGAAALYEQDRVGVHDIVGHAAEEPRSDVGDAVGDELAVRVDVVLANRDGKRRHVDGHV